VNHLQPTTRLLTGKHVHRAYVMDRTMGTFVAWCSHDHKKLLRAEQCARRLLHDFLTDRDEDRER
jgi:hypothetical protein